LETLFYELIYDKRLKRSITILEMLYRAENNVSIKELEEVLKISTKTLLTTLNFMKTLLPTTFSIFVVEKNVHLYNDTKQTVEVAIIEIAKQTISFQVFEHAFLNQKININELAKKLFISESALRVRIRHINKTLKLFGCSLSAYNVKFMGSEANIRYFGYAYFCEFQKLHLSVCEEQLQDCYCIYVNIQKELKKYGNQLMNYSYQQVIRMLLITGDRIAVGKFIKIDENFIKKIQKRASYRIFRRIYESELSKYWKIPKLPEDEIIWAYVASFNTIIYSIKEKRVLNYVEEGNQLYKERIIIILEKVMEKLEILDEDKKEFINIHTVYLLNVSLLTELSPIFQLGSLAVKNHVVNNLDALYNTWHDCLANLNEENLFPIYNIQSISAQLAMISSQFMCEKEMPIEKVLYSFEGESGFPAYLEKLGSEILPEGVEGIFIYNEPITSKLIERIKPDIVVYNYEIQEKIVGCKALRISYIPKEQEWTLLKTLIANG
jgi:Regulator of polyketide synthase expression